MNYKDYDDDLDLDETELDGFDSEDDPIIGEYEKEIEKLRDVIKEQRQTIETFHKEKQGIHKEIERSVMDKDGFHLTQEEAEAWACKIRADKNHAYWNEHKYGIAEHERSVAFVRRLDAIAGGLETSIEGYLVQHNLEKQQQRDALYDGLRPSSESRKSSWGERVPEQPTEVPKGGQADVI